MAALNSLMLAIDLATRQREQALAQLQKNQRADAFAHDQMRQLQQYAQETDLRWMQGAQIGTSTELLHHQYQFMARLSQAIALQDGVLASHGQWLSAAKQTLLKAEVRLASFKQVLAGRQAVLVKKQQRQEQKQMDEFASLQSQRQQKIQQEYVS